MEQKEFIEKIVQIHRVSKKTKGGNRIGFSVVVVVGDKKGQVGVGLGKAPDVKSGIQKGVRYAKKHLIHVPLTSTGTIPHDIYVKSGAAKVLLRRAPEGTGVIAGGAVRAVVEAAGVRNIVSKVLGTSNQASNVYACLEALRQLRPIVQSSKKVQDEDNKNKGNTETQKKERDTEISVETHFDASPDGKGKKEEKIKRPKIEEKKESIEEPKKHKGRPKKTETEK